MKVIYILVTLLQTEICENANVLGIAPFLAKSHFMMFEALFKGLAARGHTIDVFSHFPLKEKIPGYNDYPIKGNFSLYTNNLSMDLMANKNAWSTFHLFMYLAGPNQCRDTLESETMKSLRNTTKKYDLLITETFANECTLGYSHIFKIPSIGISTNVMMAWSSSFSGSIENPSYIPNYFLPYSSKMTLFERITNTGVYLMTKLGYDICTLSESNRFAKRHFGENLPNLRDLAIKTSLYLVNSHFSIYMARPTAPNIIEVGGMHINENYTLPTYFAESLKTNLKGIIYLSFGSLLVTESLPKHIIQGLFDALRNVPYKILWKGTRSKYSENLNIPRNIQFEPWLPQLGILCNSNVKVFISHGGLQSTLEAIYCGVPVLGIPVFGDQMLNIQTLTSKGLAKYVMLNNVSKASITEALLELLNNPRFSKRIKEASNIFKDRPQSALDTAIYWVEYVIRHRGARHLRTVGADLPWYQYFLVDVAFVSFGMISFIVFALYYVIAAIYRILFKTKEKIKQN